MVGYLFPRSGCGSRGGGWGDVDIVHTLTRSLEEERRKKREDQCIDFTFDEMYTCILCIKVLKYLSSIYSCFKEYLLYKLQRPTQFQTM